ncbi:MAG: hypothetical protein FWC46_08410 [Actinomycetia bacterium]|nr:hypothetical protein [Actinomycetes bacterium]
MKALALARNMGEGHNHVAAAVAEAFAARGHSCEAMDALDVYLAGQRLLASSGEAAARIEPAPGGRTGRVRDIASRLYCWAALKAPPTFGVVYALGEAYTRTPVPSPIRLANTRYVEATRAFLEEGGYDAVLAPHVFPQETLSMIRKRHPSRMRFFGILTDYACIPFFSEGRVDGYFVPHHDVLEDCVRHGMPRRRLVATGLPVGSAFRRLRSKASARARLGLPPDGPLYLLMSGGVGGAYSTTVCDHLLTRGDATTHVVVLAGRRAEWFRTIAGRFRDDPRVTVVPFTEQVPDFLAAADVTIGKPGAVSSTEAAVAGLPLVHTGAIPGVETKNARFFAERGLSVYARNVGDAAGMATSLLQDPDARARMRAAQAATLFADAADRIVRHVEGVCA